MVKHELVCDAPNVGEREVKMRCDAIEKLKYSGRKHGRHGAGPFDELYSGLQVRRD
jgi:hypothetical protein